MTVEPIGDRCLCSHLREAHDIGVRDGRKVRTKCSHAACGCRVFRPKEEQEQQR
jgi:hypothetical protein